VENFRAQKATGKNISFYVPQNVLLWLSISSKEENTESCLDVCLSINICKIYNVKVQKLADISK